jgi:hypothetical protein
MGYPNFNMSLTLATLYLFDLLLEATHVFHFLNMIKRHSISIAAITLSINTFTSLL